jgi:DNA polymerase-4
VGPALLDVLAERGLHTVEEALAVEVAWLERWLGEGRGRWLRARMLGRDDAPVTARESRKSVSSERTFATDLHEDERLERELLRLVVSVTGALRSRALRARTITLKLRDQDFTTRQRSSTLAEPVEAEGPVFAVARGLLHELRARRRTGARLLGVALSGLVDRDAPDQLPLCGDDGRSESERERRLARTVDGLRERFGHDALVPGGVLRPRRLRVDDEPADEDAELPDVR